ncbi:MAG: hypothetical protein KDD60_03570 [Bdellovibrionales bacterium]|nr:hypothetical protein [Bdellovibrionales bacterium]
MNFKSLTASLLFSTLIFSQSALAIEFTRFSGDVSKSGVVSLSAQFTGTDSSCTIVLRGDKNESNVDAGSPLTSMSVISPSLSWQRQIKRRSKGKAYVVAQLVCTDGTTSSEIVTLNSNRIQSKKKRIPASKWLNKLATALSH